MYSNATFFELKYVFNYLKHGDILTILDFSNEEKRIVESIIRQDRVNRGCYKIDNFKVLMNKSLSEKSTYKWLAEYCKKMKF